MFTRKEKNMLFDPYFEVIRETEQFIEVRSVNTGHCWSVFKNIYNAPRKITLYHKHKESDRYFHQHRVCRTVVDAVSEILFAALSQNGRFVKLNMIQYLKRRFVGNVREVEAFHRNHTDK